MHGGCLWAPRCGWRWRAATRSHRRRPDGCQSSGLTPALALPRRPRAAGGLGTGGEPRDGRQRGGGVRVIGPASGEVDAHRPDHLVPGEAFPEPLGGARPLLGGKAEVLLHRPGQRLRRARGGQDSGVRLALQDLTEIREVGSNHRPSESQARSERSAHARSRGRATGRSPRRGSGRPVPDPRAAPDAASRWTPREPVRESSGAMLPFPDWCAPPARMR